MYRTNKKILESFFFTKFHNKNLLEYYNRNIDNFNFDKIPKTCYQTWKNKTLPSEIKYIINKNKEKNPEITFKLYDDDEMDEFIQKNFDERIVKAYKQINLGVVKSDFWRYCILYINGGIYLDIKSSLETKLFGNIIMDNDICILDIKRSAWSYNSKKGINLLRALNILNGCREQWLLIFCKKHPYLKNMINNLVTNILDNNICVPYSQDNLNKKKEKILRLSGPDAFSAAIDNFIVSNCILHREINYTKIAKISPKGRPMYNDNYPHYTKQGNILLDS